ncbi:hypothetical protein FQN60_010394 [Etheostoma spectabile]|uniref:Uncharacterized protein n=1 Tax=Etheostoma spectabile TaxID=54343 RepID=A0A5J5D6F3_9PERO|nr:hypothetical protein FQN60_010394 [Etheostoma spectabile]
MRKKREEQAGEVQSFLCPSSNMGLDKSLFQPAQRRSVIIEDIFNYQIQGRPLICPTDTCPYRRALLCRPRVFIEHSLREDYHRDTQRKIESTAHTMMSKKSSHSDNCTTNLSLSLSNMLARSLARLVVTPGNQLFLLLYPRTNPVKIKAGGENNLLEVLESNVGDPVSSSRGVYSLEKDRPVMKGT